MREDPEAANPFTAEAEKRLQVLMMRQQFEFDQGHAVLLEHIGAIATKAVRQRGLGGDDLDAITAVHNYIRARYGHLGEASLSALLARLALALADELIHCGAHSASRPDERNHP